MLHLLRSSGHPLTIDWDGDGVLNVSMHLKTQANLRAAQC
jgi:hypothetical protein